MSDRTTSNSCRIIRIHPDNVPINTMIANQAQQAQQNKDRMSNQERQEIRSLSRRLRRLKRQMLLKHVEQSLEPSPVDSFRCLIMDLAVEQEAREAYRSRSNSMASDRTPSFERGDSLGSIQE